MHWQRKRASRTKYAIGDSSWQLCHAITQITDISTLQKIKQIKDKKKHQAVIKEKRQKGLLPAKGEESEDEDWEDDEEDEDDEDEDEAEGLFDMEAEESEEDESEDEEIGGVRLSTDLRLFFFVREITDTVLADYISGSLDERE